MMHHDKRKHMMSIVSANRHSFQQEIKIFKIQRSRLSEKSGKKPYNGILDNKSRYPSKK